MEAALFLIFCFLSSFLVLFAAKSRRRSTALPPGPPGWPIIGNLLQIGKAPHRSLADLSRTYGPVMRLSLGRLTTIVVSSPDAAREVLRTHDQIMSGRTVVDVIRAMNREDISMAWLPSTSPRWRLLKKISTTHLFPQQSLDSTKSARMNKVEELVTFVSQICERGGEPVDIARATFVTALNIISNALFSTNLSSYDERDSQELNDSVIRIMQILGKPNLADCFGFLGFLDLQGIRKEIKVCSNRLFQVLQGFIDARNNETSARNETDLLGTLMDLSKEKGSELNDNVIKHFLFDLILGGSDTNSTVVEWAMTELLRNPKTMARAQAELDEVVGSNGVVQESDISNLPYLQAVMKETLRLHPPGPLLAPHKAESEAKVLGFLVPKNAQVLVNVWAIGRDANVWENPERFEPERFLFGREIDVKGTDFELIPFSAGRRICPGMSLAMRTMPHMLASLIHSFQWKLENDIVPEDLDMEETFGLSLRKTNPLRAVPFKKRVHG